MIERHAQLNQPMNGRALTQNGGHRRCVGQTDAKQLSLCLAKLAVWEANIGVGMAYFMCVDTFFVSEDYCRLFICEIKEGILTENVNNTEILSHAVDSIDQSAAGDLPCVCK